MSGKAVDWEAIERDYRAGTKSVRQIARENGITHRAIHKRAERDSWERETPIREPVILVPEVPKPAAGFIYVIYIDDSAERRFFKIGLSSSFSCRFGSHQTSSPFAVCVAIAYFVGDMRQEETYLHQEFAAKRVRGEWFRLTDEDLCAIAARAKLV